MSAPTLISTARIAPGGWRETGVFIAAFARIAGRVQGTAPPAVFRTLGRHRRLFWGWLHFAGRLMPGGLLTRRETELAILRVASRRGSAYELAQHRTLGLRAGLSPVEIEGVEGWEPIPGLSARERSLLDITDEFLVGGGIRGEVWAIAAEHFDTRELIEIVMLVAHYAMLADVLDTLQLTPDRKRYAHPKEDA